MPLVQAKCENCNGVLQVDNAKDAAICPFCGAAYIVEKAINNYNNFYINQVNTPSTDDAIASLVDEAEKCISIHDFELLHQIVIKFYNKFPTDYHGYWYNLIYYTNNFHVNLDQFSFIGPNKILYNAGYGNLEYNYNYKEDKIEYPPMMNIQRLLSLSPDSVKQTVVDQMAEFEKPILEYARAMSMQYDIARLNEADAAIDYLEKQKRELERQARRLKIKRLLLWLIPSAGAILLIIFLLFFVMFCGCKGGMVRYPGY